MANPHIKYKSHAELEQYHYAAVRDSLEYRLEGMLDVLREEESFWWPWHNSYYEKVPTPGRERHGVADLTPLRVDLANLNNKINKVGDTLKKHLKEDRQQASPMGVEL